MVIREVKRGAYTLLAVAVALTAIVGDARAETVTWGAPAQALQQAPFNPASAITAASCPTATFCAIGSESGAVRTASGPTAGTWTLRYAAPGQRIRDVSCASASLCAAIVGSGTIVVSDSPASGSAWKVAHTGGRRAQRDLVRQRDAVPRRRRE